MRLPPEFCIEIDGLSKRASAATHYELLGVSPAADRDAIRAAYAFRLKRVQAPVPAIELPPDLRQRIERVVIALELAHATLSDPVKRMQYDQAQAAQTTAAQVIPRNVRAQEAVAASFVAAHARPSPSSTPPAISPIARGTPFPLRPTSGVVTVVPADAKLPNVVYPPPLRLKDSSPPSAQAWPRPASVPPSPLMQPPQPPSIAPADASTVEARLSALEAGTAAVDGERAALLAELERVTASLQLCLAHFADTHGPRGQHLKAAIDALAGTRVTLASAMARREEALGRWDLAAKLWQRAARSRPDDAELGARAAAALRRSGDDLGVTPARQRRA